MLYSLLITLTLLNNIDELLSIMHKMWRNIINQACDGSSYINKSYIILVMSYYVMMFIVFMFIMFISYLL